MDIYTDLYKYCHQNINRISDTFGLPHIENPTFEEFCSTIVSFEQTTKHDEKAKRMMSIAVKESFNNGRPANITFAGKKHTEESLQKMRDKRAGKTPSKGKTWKRTPESIARAMETQRLNRLKKLESDI